MVCSTQNSRIIAVQLSGRNGVGRHHVIEAEDDPARVPERQIEAAECVDGERSGDVVRHRDIDLGDDRVAARGRHARGGG